MIYFFVVASFDFSFTRPTIQHLRWRLWVFFFSKQDFFSLKQKLYYFGQRYIFQILPKFFNENSWNRKKPILCIFQVNFPFFFLSLKLYICNARKNLAYSLNFSFSRFWLTIFVKDCKTLESILTLTSWWMHPVLHILFYIHFLF
jgi:hypothetical protein